MAAAFRKDLGHLTWAEVLRRQEERAELVPAWLDALALHPGMRVLDVGAGPGYVSQQLAARVGPEGLVLALDRAPEAIAYLERLRDEQGLAQIRPLLADAERLDLRPEAIEAVLVTMMLHHADDPAGLLRTVAGWLASGVRAVVAEFDPTGPGTSGPPLDHRVTPEQARRWCEAAGFSVVRRSQQTPEHYMLLVQRRS
jgi:ubiquinone/menaquinone biosynthesis C-methylase UbiE